MIKTILLDTSPIGLLCAPPNKTHAVDCINWLASLLFANFRVIVPEIADYEIRRELLRAKKSTSLTRLDQLIRITEFLPINTEAMRRAADIWAIARQTGQPTASNDSIDADDILIAQAETLGIPDVVIATSNVGHLTRFAKAELWSTITP